MSLLDSIQKGRQEAPPRILLYGREGVGKSTCGSQTPNAIFVPTEDGLGQIDCHSFPTLPLPYELDQRRDRPDVCIGTDEFHTPPTLSDPTRAALEEEGFRVELNRPFSGTIVPLEYYGNNEQVRSIMVEIRRGLYMDEVTGEKGPGFEDVAKMVRRVIGGLAAGRSGRPERGER